MGKKKDLENLTGKGIYPPSFAWALLNPLRNIWLSPSKLAERLHLKEDSIVLELGCGPGYFSPHIARRVPKGKLYLTDIQPEMIEKADMRLKKKNLRNVDLRVCDGTKLPYEDGLFDIIYLVTVLGEISDQELYVKEMRRTLKLGGTVSISEQRGDPDAMTKQEVWTLFEPHGFFLKETFGRGRTYTMNLLKKN